MSVLYDSAYACAICAKKNVQIHHIDRDNTNNRSENLIVLCQEHHGEAHTQRDLTVSLSPQRLKHANKVWNQKVKEMRGKIATVGYQRAASNKILGVGVSWGYINHKRVAGLLTADILRRVEQENFELCKHRKLVDPNGLIFHQNRSPTGNYLNSTIYDQFEFGDDQRVHKLYTDFVDQLSIQSGAVHVTEESWTKRWFRQFVSPGDFLFLNRGHYFKAVAERPGNQIRKAYTFKRKINLEYLVETRDMFGTSSITVSFAGHKACTAFVMVKSIDDANEFTVHCTPIALGTGLWPLEIGSAFPDEPEAISNDKTSSVNILTR